jgi:hydroxymethylpyrimidine/phosphomethylpyrimidine kinase
MIPTALTIAGSDPSGGAGIQADIKTFHQYGVYAMSVITLVTVQNTMSVRAVELLPAETVGAQLDAVLEDIPPRAAKNGLPLLSEEARSALAERLLPHAALVTPNLLEAGLLAGMEVLTLEEMEAAALRIKAAGAQAVLVKGGHLPGDAVDVLCSKDGIRRFSSPRIDSRNTHGTGCTLSAAITAGLALGLPLVRSIETAKQFLTRAIRDAPGLGHGSGPVSHFVSR